MQHARILFAALLTFGVGAVWLPASAQEATCSDCHEIQVADASPHAGLECAECHTDVDLTELPHAEDLMGAPEVCAQCHDAGDALETSVHAGAVGCLDCHGGAHELLPASEAASPVSKVAQVGTCGECHDESIIKAFLASEHGHGLVASGLHAAPTCSDCHGSHAIRSPDDPESTVSQARVPETCGTCHTGVLRVWRDESAHGAAWQAGADDAPVCSTCHASHALPDPRGRAARLDSPETCGRCHEDAFHSYRDSFHGKATNLGFETAAICADCHTPHRNLPASDPGSTVHPDNLLTTCANCHEDIKPGFATFLAHNDPGDPDDNAVIHYTYLFMTFLLISVFAAFGLHALLWLQRTIVGMMRGEYPEEHHEGPWVKRFAAPHRWVHFTIILTFLALAATGLPLKFHWTGWAGVLETVPGAITFTRIVHRVAAVFTFGYALFHLGHLIYKGVVLKQRQIFFGPESLVPNARDLRDAVANIRYFLYLGPRPRFDRFTYWEKFDYFAVFWGIPVIGLSGLMLWFPEAVTTYLPGWTLNLAYIIHGDEALLATGFIFIFHFFHTHLRPEAFPLDPVMFTGSMPLDRFREERPAEYERLVAAGELEARLVPAPSEFQLRSIYAFGFVAVAIGVFLAIGIIWGLLTW